MRYEKLPPVGSLTLPHLEQHLTANSSSRYFAPIQKVWVHRWGGGSFGGVESWFSRTSSQASSHIVYAGEIGLDAGKCAQMVPYGRKAWTEAFYNRTGVSIECADGIWLGRDPKGFARTARIVAFLLRKNTLPPIWVKQPTFARKGFTRHGDGLQLAGGHTSCPTTDLELWRQFVARVQAEHAYSKFRPFWGIR